MTAMQKREWKKSVDDISIESKKSHQKDKAPKAVTVPPAGKSMNPKAIRDYKKIIGKKLNKDDSKR